MFETQARRTTGALRRELSVRNMLRAEHHLHETTSGATPSVVYAEDENGAHGNFYPASYRRICTHPLWAARLTKSYTGSARIAHRYARDRHELDCAASSDALLMNIFCHPTVLRSAALRSLLGVERGAVVSFGLRVRLPLRSGCDDRTEIDMQIGDGADALLVEAKLSETGFGMARPELLARYPAFEDVFDTAALPRVQAAYRSYQLLRSVLAAAHRAARFALVLDARRPELIEDVYLIYRAVRTAELRSRLQVVTWQEIARCTPRPLRRFLADKYGL